MKLSIRFDCDHQLPDKAIDLVDKGAARTRVPFLSMWETKGQDVKSIRKDTVVESGPEVTELTIAQVLSEKIGVPLEVITGQIDGMSRSRLLEMESSLKERLVGQDSAISGVCRRLLMAHAGIGKRRGPLAVFLFLGPTGVGKTELARLLAEFLFGSVSSIIRFDMSEYMEKHSAAKLIGSPPGYIGYEEEGQLTSKLRTKPYAIVLLDEIEKAHPMVFDIFLQVFDEGRLTDSKGRTADARNAIFIMTSNITSGKSMKQMGFQAHDLTNSDKTLDEFKKRFRPEFINRIDESIIFRSLNKKDLRIILKPMLDGIIKTIQMKYQLNIYIDEEVDDFIIMNGYSPEYGVRELRRTVEKLIEIPLSELIISGRIKEHNSWKCMCIEKTISFLPIIGS